MLYYSNTHKTNLSNLEILDKLNQQIAIKEDNNWKNHLFSKAFSKQKLRGRSRSNSFVVWITDSFLFGSVYPICKGNISEIGEIRILKLVIRFNPVAEIFLITFNIVLLYLLTTGVIFQENNDFNFIWKRSVIVLIIFILINSVPFFTFYKGKKRLVNLIINALDLK